MKRFTVFCMITVLALSAIGCMTSEGKEKDNTLSYAQGKVDLTDMAELKKADGTFGWPDADFGMSVTEMEAKLGVTLSWPIRWEEMDFDYRNETDYDYLLLMPYVGDEYVTVQYDKYIGHLSFEFSQGELSGFIVTFAGELKEPEVTDGRGFYINDIDAASALFIKDMEAAFGKADYRNNEELAIERYLWRQEKDGDIILLGLTISNGTRDNMDLVCSIIKGE